MKKIMMTLTALLTMAVSVNAMSYEQAREQALFLTDKMAYELNLTDAQYEAAYEINLDYLMSVGTYDDLYGPYWRQRNLDLSYVLFDWQYNAYCAASYFYRPLYWSGGYWRFGIYARYPHRSYFYFGRPAFYAVYRGGHSWHSNGGRSWYHGRNFKPHDNRTHFGMRDGWNRGDYGRGNRQSSTRTPIRNGNNRSFDSNRPNGNMNRPNGGSNNRPNHTFTPGAGSNAQPSGINRNRSFGDVGTGTSTNRSGSFGGNNSDRPSNGRSFGNSSNTTNRSFGSGSSTTGRSFGNSSNSTPSRSFGGSNSSGSRSSFGSSSHNSGGTRSGGGSSHGSSSRGGFGGHR